VKMPVIMGAFTEPTGAKALIYKRRQIESETEKSKGDTEDIDL